MDDVEDIISLIQIDVYVVYYFLSSVVDSSIRNIAVGTKEVFHSV